jgi:hypothetical protein
VKLHHDPLYIFPARKTKKSWTFKISGTLIVNSAGFGLYTILLHLDTVVSKEVKKCPWYATVTRS